MKAGGDRVERAKNIEYDNPRWHYLRKTLRLEHDPFIGFTAELDADPYTQPEAIHAKIAEDPPFYDYFVEPPFEVIYPDEPQPIVNRGLLELLLEPRPVIVIGDPGSGKTMLRYVVEHEIRVRHGHTLVVSHSLGKSPRDEDLAASLAIDLFIQTVERFRLLKTDDQALRARLWRFWQIHAPRLENVLAKLLADEEAATKSITGIARWWWRLDRPVVPNIPLTPPLRRFLEDTLYALQADRPAGERACSLTDGLELAGRLGFQQVYFLLDAAGGGRAAFVAWQHVWQHLTEPLATQQVLPFYTKYFIPTRFQNDIPLKDLPPEAISVMIAWDDSALAELIANRFRSARRWMRSFDTVSDIPHLNVQMIAAAEGSPRRLVQIASALINAHAGQAPDTPFFTAEDWQIMRQQWGGSQPPPAIEYHEA